MLTLTLALNGSPRVSAGPACPLRQRWIPPASSFRRLAIHHYLRLQKRIGMRSKTIRMRWLGFPSFAALLAACSGGADLGPTPEGDGGGTGDTTSVVTGAGGGAPMSTVGATSSSSTSGSSTSSSSTSGSGGGTTAAGTGGG